VQGEEPGRRRPDPGPVVSKDHRPAGKGGPAAPEPEWRIDGTVREAGGPPIAGALVAVPDGRAGTDREGRYSLSGLGQPPPIVAVLAEGYLPLVPPPPGRRDFELQPAAVLEGRVVDPHGAPVAGASVYVIAANQQFLDRPDMGTVAPTDRQGRYQFSGVPEGVTDVGVRAKGFLPQLERDVPIPARGTMSKDFTLRAGRTIAVTYVPEDTGAYAIAADSRLREKLLPPGGLAILADALVGRELADLPVVRGESKLDGVGEGPADVSAVFVKGGPLSVLDDATFLVEEGLGIVRDTMAPAVTLRLVPATLAVVRVRDAVTGVALEPGVTRRTDGVSRSAERAARGYLVPADTRRHVLVFELEGYETAELTLQQGRSPDDPYDVVMQPSAQGEVGTFYVVADPALEGDRRLALVGRDEAGNVKWQRQLDRTDREGRWVVANVPVGTYSVTVLATGMIPQRIDRAVVTRVTKETYRLHFDEGGGLAFKVTDEAGQLLDKVHLLLRTADGTDIDLHILTQVSDGRGFVSINYIPSAAAAQADSGLAPGDYTLHAAKEGYERAMVSFTIRSTEVAKAEITLRKQP
jgi:hypothetical protein